jgi:hypothetical protein
VSSKVGALSKLFKNNFLGKIVIMATPVSAVPSARLRSECLALGIPTSNLSRNDMIVELSANGLYEIDLQFPVKAPKIDTTNRRNDLSNVYLGNGAGLNNCVPNQLYISNSTTEHPLIGGDFQQQRVQVNHILNLKNTDFDPCRIGLEGDIIRDGPDIYMFRSNGVQPGWYPIEFGTLRIV